MESGTAPSANRTPGQAPRRVLEDESGDRLRRLRFVGRALALLAVCWLALIVLGGLGVGPAEHLPFGSELRLSVAPPPLRELPTPRQPSSSDLAPAQPAPSSQAIAGQTTSVPVPTPARASGRPATATSGTTRTPGRSAAAPGHTNSTSTTARGKATAPGQATTARTVTGGAAAAPGRLKHATTTGSTTTTPTPKTPPGQGKKP